MSRQNGDFGRRGIQPVPEASRPIPASSGGGIPPLVKQVGGMALGVALAFAIGGASVYFMKQAGKALDRGFVETANAGNPAAAIEQAGGGDALLQRVHRICTDRAATAELNAAQRNAAFDSLYVVEHRVVRGGAYVACLTREQPQRFCQKAHRDHLYEAVRQYAKLVVQAREEWQIQAGSPSAMIAGGPIDYKQDAAGMPSARIDPQLKEGLVALEADGYIPASDVARLMSNRTPGVFGSPPPPRGMPPMPVVGPAQPSKNACG
jgi:hypothetical protein